MANQSIYAAFERMWQHLSDRLKDYKPEGLATEEYVDNKVANKVDKIDGKGLSDINFTKDYENEVKKISDLQEQLGDINAILDSIIGQETAEPI